MSHTARIYLVYIKKYDIHIHRHITYIHLCNIIFYIYIYKYTPRLVLLWGDTRPLLFMPALRPLGGVALYPTPPNIGLETTFFAQCSTRNLWMCISWKRKKKKNTKACDCRQISATTPRHGDAQNYINFTSAPQVKNATPPDIF